MGADNILCMLRNSIEALNLKHFLNHIKILNVKVNSKASYKCFFVR